MIDWKKIECAIIDWVSLKFPALPSDDHHRWADQNLPEPQYPYFTFKRDTIIRSNAEDETRTSTDLSQPQGQEIALETIGIREFTLTINAYVDEETGANDPNCDAVALLTLLEVGLSQLSAQEIFCLAGLAVIENFAIVDLSEEKNAQVISRAAMDVRFRTTFSCVERTGYINEVGVVSVPCNPSGPGDVTGVDISVSGN